VVFSGFVMMVSTGFALIAAGPPAASAGTPAREFIADPDPAADEPGNLAHLAASGPRTTVAPCLPMKYGDIPGMPGLDVTSLNESVVYQGNDCANETLVELSRPTNDPNRGPPTSARQ
jgi:hypothetical protein